VSWSHPFFIHHIIPEALHHSCCQCHTATLLSNPQFICSIENVPLCCCFGFILRFDCIAVVGSLARNYIIKWLDEAGIEALSCTLCHCSTYRSWSFSVEFSFSVSSIALFSMVHEVMMSVLIIWLVCIFAIYQIMCFAWWLFPGFCISLLRTKCFRPSCSSTSLSDSPLSSTNSFFFALLMTPLMYHLTIIFFKKQLSCVVYVLCMSAVCVATEWQ